MPRFRLSIAVSLVAALCAAASADINIGIGFDYTPIVNLIYVDNPELDYEMVDNIAWQGRATYSFGNGLRAGAIFDIFGKSIRPLPFSNINLSQWEAGLIGDYSYDITESGGPFLVGGMEFGYSELTEKVNGSSRTAGSISVGGLVGFRFHIFRDLWSELDYRIVYLEYEMKSTADKKYQFTGSCLRFTLDYPIFKTRAGNE